MQGEISSGDGLLQKTDGVIITLDSDDTLEALVIARRAMEESLEEVTVPEKPMDALSHQIAGLLIQNRKWYYNEIVELASKAYPYRNVSEKDVESIASYMHSRFPRLAWVSQQDKVVMRPQRVKDLYRYYFNRLSMIPDQKQYLVIDQEEDSAIGVLDEAFVAEYGQPGTKFIVRGTPWQMVSVRGDKIIVKQIVDPTGAIPSWVGEEIPVPYEIAAEVGKSRRVAEEMYREGKDMGAISEKLSSDYPAEPSTIARALTETIGQCEEAIPVPSDKLLTIEEWEDFIIVNSHLGTLVNRTLARLIGHLLSDESGESVGIQQDPYRFVFQTVGTIEAKDVIRALDRLSSVDLDEMAITASKRTGLFKRRLVHVARRFGAISKWTDLSTVTLRQLSKSFENTVIMDEAIRETFEKDLDVPHSRQVVESIGRGEVQLKIVKAPGEVTPIARIGLERISRRTDLIPTEKMNLILIESTKARILNDVKTLVCTNCWNHVEMKRVKDVPATLTCTVCGASKIGVLAISDEEMKTVLSKKGQHLSEREKAILSRAEETSKLVARHGGLALYPLCGKRVSPEAAEEILRKHKRVGPGLFEAILTAEREALKEQFW